MQKLFSVLVVMFCTLLTYGQQNVSLKNPVVITGVLVKETKPLRDFGPQDKAIPDVLVRNENGQINKRKIPFVPSFFEEQQQQFDNALQKNYSQRLTNSAVTGATQAALTASFNGIPYQPLNPPDPSLCAGPNHLIQMINGGSGAYFKVFNKTGGQVVAQTYMDAITGKGGLGDPIALYDQLADRFIITEFNNKSETTNEGLTFAISKTNDPAGAWYVYFFSTGTTFPDYPKFSVWNDAYYGTTNDFAGGTSYAGSTVYAFDRAKMIAGNATATMQKFTLGSTNKFFSMSPVKLEGNTLPPAGTGGLIAYMQDDAWTSSTSDVDSVGIIEFKVDFTTPANTRVSTKASLAVSAYKSNICSATRGQCISQPGSSVAAEGLDSKIMNQPIYRNFGGYEGIVMTHLVDKGSSIAAARWYELRKTTGNWGVYQQSTYAPDNTHRWLPSVCYDKYGNIGLAYNVSSSATGVYPGARYTGRKECDALNTMSYAETVIVAGSAANGSTRYGDYNHLTCDPDGVTFWFTCEYNAASSWSTRIASFTLDPCSTATCGNPTSLTSSSVTSSGASLSWAGVSGAINYDADYKLSTNTTWINAATATAATSVNVSGLSASSTYDWRVRANCSGATGSYVSAQFTTSAATVICNAPTGLSTSAITSSSATTSWSAVSGAVSYSVDYKTTASSTWITAASATTSTAVNLSGLTASTTYDWRVSTNCSGASSSYATGQFTTAAAQVSCVNAYEPNESIAAAASISTGTVISAAIATTTDLDFYKVTTASSGNFSISLSNLPGDYDLYMYNSAGTQIGSSTAGGTTSENISLTNQAAGTYYIKVLGYSGANSTTVCYNLNAGFTAVTNTCPSTYDNTTHSSTSTAIAIPFNTDIKGLINTTTNVDYYKFTVTTGGTITLTLGTLPGDYDLVLYNSAGTQVGLSQNGGTTSETINYTAAAGTYYVKVFGYNGANSTTVCYTLKVALGTASMPDPVTTFSAKQIVSVFPNPAQNIVNVNITGFEGTSRIVMYDVNGRIVINKNTNHINSRVDISQLPSGIYLIKIINGNKEVSSIKVMKD